MGWFSDIFDFGGKKRKAKEEAERIAKEEAERIAREEALRKAKEMAERIAREEALRKAKEEAERIARAEEKRKLQEEALRFEAECKARKEAERKAREEARRKAKEEAERKAKEEKERKAKEEAERKMKEMEIQLQAAKELVNAIAKAKNNPNDDNNTIGIEINYKPELFNKEQLQLIINFCEETKIIGTMGWPYLIFEPGVNEIFVSGFLSHKKYLTFKNDILLAYLHNQKYLIGLIDDVGVVKIDRLQLFVTLSLSNTLIPFDAKYVEDGELKGKRIMLKVQKDKSNMTFFRDLSKHMLKYGIDSYSLNDKFISIVYDNAGKAQVSLLKSHTYLCDITDEDVISNLDKRQQLLGSIHSVVGHDDKYIYYDILVIFEYDDDYIDVDEINQQFNDHTAESTAYGSMFYDDNDSYDDDSDVINYDSHVVLKYNTEGDDFRKKRLKMEI